MDQETKEKFEAIECRMEKTDLKLVDIEKRVYSTEASIQIINTNIANINAILTEMKADIKSIKDTRVIDVYEKPMAKEEKLRFQISGAFIGAVIGIIISALAAYLK